MRRPLWLAAGVAAGVGGTLWAEHRVRRQLRRVSDSLAPSRLAQSVTSTARGAGGRVRGAVAAGRDEKQRREDELWRDLHGGRGVGPPPAGRGVGTPRAGRGVGTPRAGRGVGRR